MAFYRQLQTSFWQDDLMLELTPEEKYFYIYLMTNPKTTQCGIYPLSVKLAACETGYDSATVGKLLKRFQEYGRVIYSEDTKEIMIQCWVKYNFINSRNTITCMNKELKGVKHKPFLERLYVLCEELGYPLETIFEGIKIPGVKPVQEAGEVPAKGLEGAYKDLGEEEIKEIEEEINKKVEDIEEVFKKELQKEQELKKKAEAQERAEAVFSSNIHPIAPLEAWRIAEWLKEVEVGVVLLAIEEAVNNSAKTMSYIAVVMDCWIKYGITTEEEALSYIRERRRRRQRLPGEAASAGTAVNQDKNPKTNAAAYKVLGEEEDV